MLKHYSGPVYIWSLAQAAVAAHKYPSHPPTWQGLDGLQATVARSGEQLDMKAPRNVVWAQAAFADASARFNFQYEQVPA